MSGTADHIETFPGDFPTLLTDRVLRRSQATMFTTVPSGALWAMVSTI